MAAYSGGRGGGEMRKSEGNAAETDLLLHPELLSEDFIKLVLNERKICTEDSEGRDQLTDLYIQHVIPLPQRELPNSRWGKRMEKTKARQSSTSGHSSSSSDCGRKRPLIVFDGSSSSTGSVKLKKPDDFASSAVSDRLKPPPSSINLTNPIRKLSGSSTNCSPSSSTVSSSTRTPASASGATKSPTGNGNLSSSGHSSNTNPNTKLKRGPPNDGVPGSPELKSPEVKKKIQHVTWP